MHNHMNDLSDLGNGFVALAPTDLADFRGVHCHMFVLSNSRCRVL